MASPTLCLNCVRADGSSSVVEQSLAQLLQEYPEIGRDSHLLDVTQDFKPSSIIAAERIILLKINHIHCLITSELVLIPQKCGYEVISYLKATLEPPSDLPFEFRAFAGVCQFMREYFDITINALIRKAHLHRYIVDAHRTQINYAQRVRLAQYSSRFLEMEYRLTDIFEVFERLTKLDNETKYRFYLSDHLKEPVEDRLSSVSSVSTVVYDTQSFDRITKTFMDHFEENVDQIQQQKGMLQVINELQQTQLTIRRNQLAETTLMLAILSLAISVANLISSAFGMNLNSGLENTSGLLWVVFSIMVIMVFALFHFSWNRFKKI